MKKSIVLLLVLLLCGALLGCSGTAPAGLKEKPFPNMEKVARKLGIAEGSNPRWIASAGGRLVGLCTPNKLEKHFFMYEEGNGTAAWLPLTGESVKELLALPMFNPRMFFSFGDLRHPADIASGGDGRYLLASTMNNCCILFDLEEKCTHWIGPYTNVTSAGKDTAYAFSAMDRGIVRIRYSDRSVTPVLAYQDIPAKFSFLSALAALDEQTLLLCLQTSTLKQESEKKKTAAAVQVCLLRLTEGAPEAVVSEAVDVPNSGTLLHAGGKHALLLHVFSNPKTEASVLMLAETEHIQDSARRLVAIEDQGTPKAALTDADGYRARAVNHVLPMQPFGAALSGDGKRAALLCINDQMEDTALYLMDTETLALRNVPLPASLRGKIMTCVRMYDHDLWLIDASQALTMLRYQLGQE